MQACLEIEAGRTHNEQIATFGRTPMTEIQNAVPQQNSASTKMTPSDELASYREEYSVKPMQRSTNNADELILMLPANGMYELPSPPAKAEEFPQVRPLPATRTDAPIGRHLWVIRPTDMPVALEACDWGKSLASKRITHSNLTGGLDAHSGGEMWFVNEDRIGINAASGRYGANSEREFDQIVDALRRSGYHVAPAGFDLDNKTVPNRAFPGDPDWRGPL